MNRIVQFFLIIFLCLQFGTLEGSDKFEFTKEFTLITSKNAEGFLKPLFTTLEEGWNSDLYTRAIYNKTWSLALDISMAGMIIPNSQRDFEAVLPDLYENTTVTRTSDKRDGVLRQHVYGTVHEPTLYGGLSNPVFSTPQNLYSPDSLYKTVAFIEGKNIDFMPALPNIQLVAGFPTRTQLRLRFFTMPLKNVSLYYYTVAINQNIDRLFNIFNDSTNALAINGAYHSISRRDAIDITSYSVGFHYSKTWNFGLSLLAGIQYEDMTGKFEAVKVKDTSLTSQVISSPYPEIRNDSTFNINLSTFNKFRFTVGIAYKISFLDFHAQFVYASQPALTAGISFWFFETKEPKPEPPPVIQPIIDTVPPPVIAKIEPPVPPPMPVIPEPPPPPKPLPLLNGQLYFSGITNNVEKNLDTIQVTEYQSRQIRAILPYIFFDENSSVLDTRYQTISKEEALNFTYSNFLGLGSLETYRSCLNLFGYRLNLYPKAKIILTGCNNNFDKEKNNKELSKQRATVIKDYLVNVWNISEDRIKVAVRNLPLKPSNIAVLEGRRENQRTEISSDNPLVIAPLIINDTIIQYEPEIAIIKPKYIAEDTLSEWELSLSNIHGFKYNIRGTSNIEATYKLNLNGIDPKRKVFKDNIDAYLKLKDKANQDSMSQIYHLPVRVVSVKEKREKGETDEKINKYNLILFDYDKSNLSAANNDIIKIIKKDIEENAIITIRGFTDIIGDAEHNKNLSYQRSQVTAKALGFKNAEILGLGSSELIYENTSPEGRFYSRTVIIEVRNPVKK